MLPLQTISLTTNGWYVVLKQSFTISVLELLKRASYLAGFFFYIPTWYEIEDLSLALPERVLAIGLTVLCCRSVCSSLGGTILCVNQRRNTWNVSFQVIIRKSVTLDALQSKYNVSEIISKAPFALMLMALCEQIQTCTEKGKLYECAFVFEKVYEKSQIKLIFYKITWILCSFWSFFLCAWLVLHPVLRCHTILRPRNSSSIFTIG